MRSSPVVIAIAAGAGGRDPLKPYWHGEASAGPHGAGNRRHENVAHPGRIWLIRHDSNEATLIV